MSISIKELMFLNGKNLEPQWRQNLTVNHSVKPRYQNTSLCNHPRYLHVTARKEQFHANFG